MAVTVTVPFWPNSRDCLAWSADNHLAIVGGEHIAILTPRLHEKGLNGSLWDKTIIKVNAFTADELPVEATLSNKNFSVGEELSLRQAVSAKWSPPGLAQYEGCALAVLTADHVLSIWASDGKSTLNSSWKRRLIVNHAIRDFYQDQNSQRGHDDERHERSRVQQRIRAFAWSPPTFESELDIETAKHIDCGHQFLVVSTEGGHLFYFHIRSPHVEHTIRTDEWTADIAATTPVSSYVNHAASPDIRAGLSVRKTQRKASAGILVAEQVEWGPWKIDFEDLESCSNKISLTSRLALITDETLIDARIRCCCNFNPAGNDGFRLLTLPVEEQEKEGFEAHITTTSEDVTFGAPLRFVPNLSCALVTIGYGSNVTFAITHPASSLDNGRCELGDQWDHVSGIAFVMDSKGQPRAHIATEISSLSQPAPILALPKCTISTSQAEWQTALHGSKYSYAVAHDLHSADDIQEHVWGMANDNLCEYVATCASMHPSNVIAYIIGSDQACVVNITHESELTADRWMPIPMKNNRPSMETLLFSLKRSIERKTVNRSLLARDFFDQMATQILDHIPAHHFLGQQSSAQSKIGDTLNEATKIDRDVSKTILWTLRSLLFDTLEARKERASRIVNIALTNSVSNRDLAPFMVQQLVLHLRQLSRFAVDHISLLVETNRAIIQALLDLSTIDTGTLQSQEACKICSLQIPFEALKWAKCRSGHEFPRCALSFLAIQEPGTTKSCGVCGLLYLNEQAIPQLQFGVKVDAVVSSDVDHAMRDAVGSKDTIRESRTDGSSADANEDRTAPTLAQFLFAACDVCLYCGGKFTT